jgi:hypothetical protein
MHSAYQRATADGLGGLTPRSICLGVWLGTLENPSAEYIAATWHANVQDRIPMNPHIDLRGMRVSAGILVARRLAASGTCHTYAGAPISRAESGSVTS